MIIWGDKLLTKKKKEKLGIVQTIEEKINI